MMMTMVMMLNCVGEIVDRWNYIKPIISSRDYYWRF